MSESSRGILVIGAGGHARVVISALQAAGHVVREVIDDDSAKWGTHVLGVPVGGPVARLEGKSGAAAVIAIGNNAARKSLADRLNLEWVTVVHPNADVHGTVRLGRGTVAFSGAVVQPEAVIGDHVILNTAATVDHNCILGDYVHLAPGTNLAGDVRVGEGGFMGIGSAAVPGITIGEWSTVGAGGVVVRDLPPRCIAVGVPARVRVE